MHEDVLRERLQEEEAERADRARLEIEEQLQELAEFRRLRDMERERDQAEVAHYQRPTDKQFNPGLPTCSGVHAGVTCGCLGGGGGRVAEDSCNPPKV